jgi:hypothetical protein
MLLPSRHQINDRVSVHFSGAYIGAQVVGVFFNEAKVLYTVVTDGNIQLENVDSCVVLDPLTGVTD